MEIAAALAASFVVSFVVAYLANPTVGAPWTRGAFGGALGLGLAAYIAAGLVFGAPTTPLTLDHWLVVVAGFAAVTAPVERALAEDRPVRVFAVRALLGTVVGAAMLWPKFWQWPLNHAAGAAVVVGGWVFVAALLADGMVERRPLFAGAHLGAWVAVTIAFVVGAGNAKFGLVGGTLGVGLLGLLAVRALDRGAGTEGILRGAPTILAAVLGALVGRTYLYNASQDVPPLACGALLLLAVASPRAADALRTKLGENGAAALGLVGVLVFGLAAAGLAGSISTESTSYPY